MTNEVYKVGEKVDAVKKVTDGAVFIIDIKSREGKIISKDTIWGKEQKKFYLYWDY